MAAFTPAAAGFANESVVVTDVNGAMAQSSMVLPVAQPQPIQVTAMSYPPP